jgi:hypothetical protein
VFFCWTSSALVDGLSSHCGVQIHPTTTEFLLVEATISLCRLYLCVGAHSIVEGPYFHEGDELPAVGGRFL